LDFAKRWEAPLATLVQPHPHDRSPERRLKIGYVSSDFRQHSVAWFIEPVLAHHDRERFEIFCYANLFQEDAVTERLKAHADHWRKIYGLPDELAAQQIRADQIDILVDLNGHTAENRLLVFARKPAPVQVTWLGYPNTTGLSAMDYRLTDGFADPVGMTEPFHSETLIRLPECFSCYQPPRDAPAVSELPAKEKGYITFGSFNKLTKVTPEVMATWARILQAVPGSRLALQSAGLGEDAMQQMVREAFAGLGITPERLELHGHDRSQKTHLERYRNIDIGLDPFPYNGTTTTCDALWMGVPVVTLAGKVHAGRVGVSQMSNLGLTELIGQTPEEYVAIATRLATDRERLGALRKELRSRMTASPLMDAPRFTTNLEQAYRGMWKDWCLGLRHSRGDLFK
jgi:predicted O-linked N-acetylglucosamine transferase (SPINDLY family)